MIHRRHSRYHPRWYRKSMPIFWWLGKGAYIKFIARELTSLAVAYSSLLILAELWALGNARHEAFHALLAHPFAVALHALVLAALLFHTMTWLHLAPQALVLKIAGRRVPDGWIVTGHYLAWGAISAVIAWFLLGAWP